MKTGLSTQQIDDLLTTSTAWSLQDGMLVRSWTFPDFLHAMAFVNRIAALAEQANHHPDIHISYSRVQLALISHDVACLSSRDAAMVRQIDASFPA